jgi:hypothetical protein
MDAQIDAVMNRKMTEAGMTKVLVLLNLAILIP